eukprot:CAMPEP_0198225132 /NCGR_PEP_ID=MMETSP1445-20131203/99786_1 /TAXON_ID=36898 /ORGANISM="Pyramimonas sp., Strain CCMP2087" /LENGTH=233 /DNA_ID=CAMNT_0043904539 /DNA_START=673 /DNA_END=1371 /DNA_ORIENTATION=-
MKKNEGSAEGGHKKEEPLSNSKTSAPEGVLDATHEHADKQTKRGRKTCKTSTANPLSMLSFGDEMDDAGANNLSMGENTAKRFREAPPPAATLPAMTIEMLSAFNRSAGAGVALSSSENHSSSSGQSLAALRIGSAQARGSRPYMEDRHTIVTSYLPEATAADGVPRSYFGLFDGHNGARAAEMAAYRLHTILATDMSFRSASESGADEAVVAGALTRSFLALEREMLNIFDA